MVRMTMHLAELNVARLSAPLDHVDNVEFVAVLEAVNRIAEVSDGFVWRLQDDDGRSASYVTAYDDPQMIVNLSVWTTPEALRHFVYRSGHGAYLRRRREWFTESTTTDMVCWWLPVGHVPDLSDAIRRLEHLCAHGSSSEGFAFTESTSYPPA